MSNFRALAVFQIRIEFQNEQDLGFYLRIRTQESKPMWILCFRIRILTKFCRHNRSKIFAFFLYFELVPVLGSKHIQVPVGAKAFL